MSEIILGKLIEGNGPRDRDAIHVAVYPALAAENLRSGDHVGRITGEYFGRSATKYSGIVDPFLVKMVQKNERFWLCLYPQTVTGMRHHWQHPGFPDVATPVLPTLTEVIRSECGLDGKVKDKEKAESEAWLRDYACKLNCELSEEEAYRVILHDLKTGWLEAHGSDLHELGDLRQIDDLRYHAEIILGQKLPNWDEFRFSCSC